MIRIGVDIGGTFTDFVAVDTTRGRAVVWKRLTTPTAPADAVLLGIDDILRETGWDPARVELVVHGTTLVANAIIERKGARTGLIATAGHRHALEVGAEQRYDVYDLFLERPAPLVPGYLREGVSERIDASGRELTPLDDESVRSALRRLRDGGIEALAVSLLHSYANDAHEQRVRAIVDEELPGIDLSLSSVVAPEMREYERTSTTVANAYVQPLMRSYLDRLGAQIKSRLPNAELYVMLSNGGLTTPQQAATVPIQLVESGPAAGVVAAQAFGEAAGRGELLAFDMGGSTAKLCLITGGAPAVVHEIEVARWARFKRGSGLPLLLPTVRLIEIGAGGGSIARADRQGLLKVGPDSAGASPGPACYGLGGTAPTVTDANLYLGYLDEHSFLGGRMQLDREAAVKALAGVGAKLGLTAEDVARGIHEIVNENMASAARRHVAEQARDPRRHVLVALGGCGPSHAYGLARRMHIETVISPPAAGAASALGCLVAPPAVALSRSLLTRTTEVDWSGVRQLYADLDAEARRILAGAKIDAADIRIERWVDMRYHGQGFEVPVLLSEDWIAREDLSALLAAFVETYVKFFGHDLESAAVDAVTWRLVARGPANRIDLTTLRASQPTAATPLRTRRAYFAEMGGFVECPVYERNTLPVGAHIQGPALVEEPESTVVIGPSAAGVLDAGLNLVMTINSGRSDEPRQRVARAAGPPATMQMTTALTDAQKN